MSTRPLYPALLLTLLICGCANLITLPQNRTTTLAPAGGQTADAGKVRQALITAAYQRGWTVVSDQPGQLELSLTLRSHRLTVDVPYTSDAYTVHYVSSENLGYREENGTAMIHKRYLAWLRNLEQSTRAALLAQQ